MKNAKKYILVVLLVAVVFGAGYLNYRLGLDNTSATDTMESVESSEIASDTSTDGDTATSVSASYFEKYKANRETTRQQEISYLESIIADEKSDEDILADAKAQQLEIVNSMEKELTLEGLLSAKGFGETLVTVQTGSVNVVVQTDSITEEQVAQILDIVQTETNEPAKNIKIIPQVK
ncbi:MAG: SpoIIIAH-like family protein [Eubacteriales bacterium]